MNQTPMFNKSIVIGQQTRFLSPFYLELALQSIKRYRRAKRKPEASFLEVFILVAVSLEAFINEVCLEKIDRRKDAGKSTHALELLIGQRVSIRNKWRLLPKRLWRGKKFDRRSRLWRDFHTLIELRNALVHYKSEYQEPGYVPDFLKPTLSRILKGREQKPEGNRHWTKLICTIEMGYWALDTGLNMVYSFLEFVPSNDDLKEDYFEMLWRLHLGKSSTKR